MIDPWVCLGLIVITAILYSVMFYYIGFKRGKKVTEKSWEPMMATNVDLAHRAAHRAANIKIREFVIENIKRMQQNWEEYEKAFDIPPKKE